MRPSLLCALLLATVAVSASAQDRRDDGRLLVGRMRADRIDTTVTISADGIVALTANRGDVIVHTGAAGHVVVHANADQGRVRFDASDHRVSVDASDAGGDSRIEVTVPAGVRITAQARNGDVSIRGTGGDVTARTLNGDVNVDDASGHVDLNTLSGDITGGQLKGTVSANSISGEVRLSDVTGNVSVSSVSGDLTLAHVTSQSVDAQSTSGDIAFDGGIDPAGRYSFVTHSGDVSLNIPASASAQLTISTWSGSIDSDFPITLQPGEHDIGIDTGKRFTFSIGGGEARIRAESFNGDITIRRHGGR